jgi:hypothetical protein
MEKIPTAREFLLENADRFQCTTPDEWLIEFAKLHVEQALKEVSKITHKNGIPRIVDDKDSILNSYPLENIK